MKKAIISIQLLLIIAIFHSCTTTSVVSRKKAYPEFYNNALATILIMPPINKTNMIDAKEYFYTTLARPLCERGYYVIPTYLSMEVFKNESAYDADIFLNKPNNKFAEFFNADIVLFTIIHRWEKMAMSANITVDIEYIAKSTKTNTVAYTRRGTVTLDTSVSSGGGIGGALVSMAANAVATAMTPHVKAARACNEYTFKDFPLGKYSSEFLKDSIQSSDPKIFSATVKPN